MGQRYQRKIDLKPLHRDILTRRHPRQTTLTLQLQRAEHRNRILTLVRNGASPEQVLELLREGQPPIDVTPSEVQKFVKAYLNKIHTEDALTIEELRVLENERLDRLWSQLAATVRNADGTPNLKVVDRMTRLSERRSKMNGLEAAQRHEHVVYDGLAAMGLDSDLIERGKQAWLESGHEGDVIEASFEEVGDGTQGQ